MPDVLATRRDTALMRRVRSYSLWADFGRFATAGRGGDRTMARQMLHVQDACALIAKHRMPIDWLLHIDHDELFKPRERNVADHFSKLAGIDQAIYLNHEAVPESVEVDDVFRDITLFKRNPAVVERLFGRRASAAARRLFMAYWNGKAAIRVASGAIPNGVHRFIAGPRPIETVWLEEPYILHYPNCGFARWRTKYEQLGRFGNRWFGGDAIKLSFHLRSRDLATKPDAVARTYYRRRALLSGRRDVLLDRGMLVRVTGPRRLLSKAANRSERRKARASAATSRTE
jgi:hypothetical protein